MRDERSGQTGPPVAGRAGLRTGPFVGVLVLALVGFASDTILRATVPLVVLDRGGGAVVVGLIAAVYAVPSILLRPLIGDLVDRWDHRRLLRLGATGLAVLPLLQLVPGLVTLAVARFVHGTGWATFSVANHAFMAKLAPAERRGEAAGYYMVMPALATLIAPGLAVVLYTSSGEIAPVVAAMALGLVAVLIALRMPVPPSARAAVPADTAVARSGWRERVIERSTVPVTVMLTAFMSANSLFVVFPPVYALAVGAPVEVLAIYYPIYGLVLTVTQLFSGRVSDALGRATTIRLGAVIAIGGLAVMLVVEGIVPLAVSAAAYGVAVSLASPAISALAIDLAPAGRLGAAVATYTVGYQLATGVSGILWGVIIAAVGFPWPFAAAIGLQVLTLGLSRRY